MSVAGSVRALHGTVVADLYRAACLIELDALKVGNVHAYAAGHRMQVSDFVTSAEVSAPHLARQGARIGERVRASMQATLAAVAQNTNLGILLLCAPLAAAAEQDAPLRQGLAGLLDTLDEQDGRDVFSAIRLANPGGLGKAPRLDVTEETATVSLQDAMREAADRDRIARAYVTGFEDLFVIGLPALAEVGRLGLDPPWSATAVHLAYLTRVPDSHIVRKHGAAHAEAVRSRALAELGHLDLSQKPVETLLAHDRLLKEAGVNPGTSADFTVATLFLGALLAERAESG